MSYTAANHHGAMEVLVSLSGSSHVFCFILQLTVGTDSLIHTDPVILACGGLSLFLQFLPHISMHTCCI